MLLYPLDRSQPFGQLSAACAGKPIRAEICTLERDVKLHKHSVIVSCAWALAFLIGCFGFTTGCHRADPPQAYKNDSDDAHSQLTQNIDINFYVDASGSMRGFRAVPPDNQVNQFTEMLDKADGILKEAWPNVTIHYWRFGSRAPQPIPSIREFSRRDDLFSDNETHIDLAIQHEIRPVPGQAQLKIIVTDLFQN